MGQKANINSLQLITNKDWNSLWYSNPKEYKNVLSQDLILMNYLKSLDIFNSERLIVKIRICRISKNLIIDLRYFSDKSGDSSYILKNLTNGLRNTFQGSFNQIFVVTKLLSLQEVKTDAVYLSKKIGRLVENRIKFKSHLIKELVNQAFEGLNGVKVSCKGRLNGADMADNDCMSLGSIPFQTFKANIDYGFSVANTAKGLLSVKVWVYRKLNS